MYDEVVTRHTIGRFEIDMAYFYDVWGLRIEREGGLVQYLFSLF